MLHQQACIFISVLPQGLQATTYVEGCGATERYAAATHLALCTVPVKQS